MLGLGVSVGAPSLNSCLPSMASGALVELSTTVPYLKRDCKVASFRLAALGKCSISFSNCDIQGSRAVGLILVIIHVLWTC